MIHIIRPINLLLLLAVLFTLWFRLCVPNLAEAKLIEFILISVSVISIAAAAYIINDIIDSETDKINKPKKVYVDKYISKKNALILYIFLNAVAITAATFVLDPFIIIISVFSIALLYLYSLKLKQSIFWGNLIVALLSALPILEMYIFFKPFGLEMEFIAYALFAFLTSLIREIVKDKEDAEGDLKSGINTLANSISEKQLKIILMSINSLLLLSLLCFLFLLKIETIITLGIYLMTMVLPGILLFFLIGRLKNKKSYSNTSLYLKVYMFLGLIRLWL